MKLSISANKSLPALSPRRLMTRVYRTQNLTHSIFHQVFRSVATYCPPHHAAAISVLTSDVDISSENFQANARQMKKIVENLEDLVERIYERGPLHARQKHIARKKMLPRDRITSLIDTDTSFLELSVLAGHELYNQTELPAGGIITGVGVVEGVTCMIVANDSTVKGGTYFPITIKKHLRAQEIAQENNLP